MENKYSEELCKEIIGLIHFAGWLALIYLGIIVISLIF